MGEVKIGAGFEIELADLVAEKPKEFGFKRKSDWIVGFGGSISAGVTLRDGRVFFGCADYHVYCVDAKQGKEIWRFETSVKTKSMIENLDRMPIVAPEVERVIREDVERRDEALEKEESDILESTYSARIEYVFKDIYGGRKKRYEDVT